MYEREISLEFHSTLGALIQDFLREKLACGYRYTSNIHQFRRLDRFFCEVGLSDTELPKQVVMKWISKHPHESPRTHREKIYLIRQLAVFMKQRGFEAFIPDTKLAPKIRLEFTPYIFSHDEIRKIIESADNLSRDYRSPLRHLVIPEIFRLLYCCGMRVGEVIRLKVADIDTDGGIITVREGKFRKDRLVPMTPSMSERLRKYESLLGRRNPEAYYFPAPDGGNFGSRVIYAYFRRFLRLSGISHGGRGNGPRLHDLRHTFAVHRLEIWYREGVELEATLPLLAVYLGHRRLSGTQRYLRLTPNIFPDITASLEKSVGFAIPGRGGQ
ncbi:MAG: tyrosine-type recombinase/integrase [FCB group bacterium]|nr:tyrosine-type recombinase/integrase [FCB group bacterium]